MGLSATDGSYLHTNNTNEDIAPSPNDDSPSSAKIKLKSQFFVKTSMMVQFKVVLVSCKL